MKCTECGYEYKLNAENWVYLGDGCYEIKSNIFDSQILMEMAEHALTLIPHQEEIYIDTWLIGCLPCSSCALQNIRNQRKRSEVEQIYYSKGLNITYYL